MGHKDKLDSGACMHVVVVLLSWDRFGATMRTLLLPFFLMACEQVPPTGNPLQPVDVAPAAATEEPLAGTEGAEDVSAVDAEDANDDVFSISSEELAAIVDGTDPRDVPTEATDKPVAPETDAETAPAAPAAAAAPPEPTPPPAPVATPGWPTPVTKAWPVRLVTTVPNASPPRAILGLPDGREVVVNPGSMVPDLGIVVVAISPNSAELAKVAPAGDHATIESMTLTAQY